MKHYFNRLGNVTLKVENGMATDEISRLSFPVADEKFQAQIDDGTVVEITQNSYELLTASLQQFYKDVNEFAVNHPAREVINNELKNYGV